MATKPKNNKATRTLTFTQILAGITKHVTTAILLGGASTTEAALAAIFQAAIQAQTDLDAARTVVATKVKAQQAALATARTTEVLLHKWAEATFGPTSTVLEDFGFVPDAAADVTAAVKAASAAKGKATRAAKKAALAAVGQPSATPAPAATPVVVATPAPAAKS
jgi:hypothetical protein